MTYAQIKKLHNHMCNWKCDLPKTIEMTSKEFKELEAMLKPAERPASFYKGMKIIINDNII